MRRKTIFDRHIAMHQLALELIGRAAKAGIVMSEKGTWECTRQSRMSRYGRVEIGIVPRKHDHQPLRVFVSLNMFIPISEALSVFFDQVDIYSARTLSKVWVTRFSGEYRRVFMDPPLRKKHPYYSIQKRVFRIRDAIQRHDEKSPMSERRAHAIVRMMFRLARELDLRDKKDA